MPRHGSARRAVATREADSTGPGDRRLSGFAILPCCGRPEAIQALQRIVGGVTHVRVIARLMPLDHGGGRQLVGGAERAYDLSPNRHLRLRFKHR